MREKVFCFSGHRTISDFDFPMVQQRTEELIRRLLNRGFNTAIVGGAVGFDLLALRLLIEIRKEYTELQIWGVFPFSGYDSKWTLAQREEYAALIPQLDKLVYISDKGGSEAFLERNRKMVEGSSALICYYNESRKRSGTGQCVRYAQKLGLEVINIADFLR